MSSVIVYPTDDGDDDDDYAVIKLVDIVAVIATAVRFDFSSPTFYFHLDVCGRFVCS